MQYVQMTVMVPDHVDAEAVVESMKSMRQIPRYTDISDIRWDVHADDPIAESKADAAALAKVRAVLTGRDLGCEFFEITPRRDTVWGTEDKPDS